MKGLIAPLALVFLAGCATVTPVKSSTATVDLKNATGRSVGTATLSEVPGGVRIVMEVKGLPPGPKGVHIHEAGKCEGPQFTSAGGHFNPEKKEHGTLNPRGPHAGDLPNVTIAGDGSGRLETTTNRVTLGSGASSVFDADGSSLVVHAGPDDFLTDPTGNSGGRSACGVIVKKD